MREYLAKRKRIFSILAPTVFGILYMLICMTCLRRSVWTGESYSAYLTHFGFREIFDFSAAGTQPPLYYVFLKIWAHIFGRSDFGLRFMSVFFGAIAIMFAYMWMKYKYGAKSATLGALLLSLSPLLIRCGQEIQPFTMATAIVLASTYFLQLALDNEKQKWWITYAVLVAAGLWTSYYAAFAFLAQLIYLCFVYGKRVLQKRVFLTFGLACLLFAAWLPKLIAQLPQFGANPVSLHRLADFCGQAFLLRDADSITGGLLLLLITGISLVALFAAKYRHGLRFLLCGTLAPVLALIIFSVTPFALELAPEKNLFSVVCATMLGGVSIVILANNLRLHSTHRQRANWAFAGSAVILLLLSASGIGASFEPADYDFDKLHQNLATVNAVEQLPIVTDDPWLYYNLSFYDASQVFFLAEDANYDSGLLRPLEKSYFGKISKLDAYLEKHHLSDFWLVKEAPAHGDIASPIPGFASAQVLTLQFRDHGQSFEAVHFAKE